MNEATKTVLTAADLKNPLQERAAAKALVDYYTAIHMGSEEALHPLAILKVGDVYAVIEWRRGLMFSPRELTGTRFGMPIWGENGSLGMVNAIGWTDEEIIEELKQRWPEVESIEILEVSTKK